MDHLQQAKHAIEAAPIVNSEERAILKTQMAIAHAMIALVERMDKMAKTQELALEHSEDLYALPSN